MRIGKQLLDLDFYSRPCGRGDLSLILNDGAQYAFLLTPLREGRPDGEQASQFFGENFYSRPCGRGDRRFFKMKYSGD